MRVSDTAHPGRVGRGTWSLVAAFAALAALAACQSAGPRASVPTTTDELVLHTDEALAALRSDDALRAEDLLRRAIAGDEGAAPQARATARATLAQALLAGGRTREAAEFVEAALVLHEQGSAAWLETLGLRARIAAREGRLTEAVEIARRVLQDSASNPHVPEGQRAWASANLGRMLWAKGVALGAGETARANMEEGHNLLVIAMQMASRNPARDEAQLGVIASQLGEASLDLGYTDRAVTFFDAAWEHLQRAGLTDDSRAQPLRLAQARLLLAQGQAGRDALREFLRLDAERSISQLARLTDDEKQAALYRREEAVRIACEHALTTQDTDAIVLALEAVWSWKGLRVDAARVELDVLRDEGSDAEKRAFERIVAGRAELASRTLDEARGMPARRARTGVRDDARSHALRKAASDLRQGGLARSPQARLRTPTWAEVASCLGADEVMIEYVVHRPWRRGHDGDDRLIAFCFRPGRGDGRVQLFDLGPLSTIAQACASVRHELALAAQAVRADPAAMADTLASREARLAARLCEARALVWQPLAQAVRGAKLALVAPDGPLASLPLDALGCTDGTGVIRYRIDDDDEPTITMVQTLRDVLWWRDAKARGVSHSGEVVLVGDPALGTPNARLAARPGAMPVWTPAQGTGQFIASLREGLSASLPGARVLALTGGRATEERVMRLRNPAALVVAAHGWMWSNADPQELDSRAGVDRSIRSMLVLAGANEPARGGKDGLLTAFELMGGPDLRGTHLVVLAACSSGAEESEQDGGAQGMRRAMQIAGARCVIASGFDVPAKQSLELMDDFRSAWLAEGGMSRVQAFAHAKRGALARARERDGSGHPLWWAGFSYFGDPGVGPLPADLRAP